ncbi:MAG: hypothetical protein WDO18_01745 [Acidobacteriota bacterium]
MRPRFALGLILFGCIALDLLHAQQGKYGKEKPWAEYPGQSNTAVPPDYKEPHEWVWARLRYSGFGGGFGGGFGRRRGGFGGWGFVGHRLFQG